MQMLVSSVLPVSIYTAVFCIVIMFVVAAIGDHIVETFLVLLQLCVFRLCLFVFSPAWSRRGLEHGYSFG